MVEKNRYLGLCGLFSFILIGLALMAGPTLLRAQTSFGTIIGVVTDPSGAAVPDVAITVTNARTGVSRQARTDGYGNYTVSSLLPGLYNLRAERQGFQVTEIANVELPVVRTVTQNILMELGAVTETVEVSAAAPLLDTSSATVGTVVENRSVTALPLNGRGYTDLIALVPGSVPRGTLFAIARGDNYSVSGAHTSQNNFTLDGINNNEIFFKQFAIQPSIDAIQEFRVQTHITSAEYGQAAGSNVNVALKSGTNEIHGAIFEFLRNDKLDANDFFRNANPLPANHPAKQKRAFRQNQYGFVVGGPIVIPGAYDGRDKAFWLFNYEGFKVRRQSSNVATVPTTTQLSGDLRDQLPIFDPLTTQPDGAGGFTRSRIHCNGVLNVICPDRIYPAAADFASTFFPSTNQLGANNILNLNPFSQNQWQINIKADYKIKDNLMFYSRYSHASANEINPQALPTVDTIRYNEFRNAVASWTYVPSPTLVIDFKVGLNRSNVFQNDTNPAPGAESYFQANRLQGTPIKDPDFPLYPRVNVQGYTAPSQSGVPLPVTDVLGLLNISKVRGRHTLKFGFHYDNVRGAQDNFFTSGFTFTPEPTQDPQNPAGTGSPLAAYLLGLPVSGSRNLGNTLVHMRWLQWQTYVQDDFKVTPKLTLNLGLRYEYVSPPRDLGPRADRQGMFDRTSGQFVWASTNPLTGAPPNIRPGIRDPDFNNFAPRLGFAYQLSPKTTLRSGYSIFYSTNFLWEAQGIRGQWPYALSENQVGRNLTVVEDYMETFWSPDLDVTPDSPPSGIFSLGRTDRTGYSQQWNLGIQRALAKDLMLEVDYVGTGSRKQSIFMTTNTPLPGPGDIQSRRPFPQAGALAEGLNRSSATYHGLQLKLEKRFSSGLQFLGSYALAKYIDVGGGGIGTSGIQTEHNLAADRAVGVFDRRHIFTGSYYYQLPFGRGQRFLTQANSVVNGLLGGWEITGITRYNTGAPVNILLGFDNGNTGLGSTRPDRVVGQPARIGGGDKTRGWFNPAAFRAPPPFSFGNLGRNAERGPNFGNWDFGLFKNFPIREEVRIQFRSEFFNLFNNVNLGAPGGTLGTAGFGVVGGTANRSREIQFALKVIF